MSAYSDICKENGIKPAQQGVKLAGVQPPKPAADKKKKGKGKKKNV